MNLYSYILISSRQATANARVFVAQKESKIVPEAAHVRDKTITAPTNASVVLVINHAKIGYIIIYFNKLDALFVYIFLDIFITIL